MRSFQAGIAKAKQSAFGAADRGAFAATWASYRRGASDW